MAFGKQTLEAAGGLCVLDGMHLSHQIGDLNPVDARAFGSPFVGAGSNDQIHLEPGFIQPGAGHKGVFGSARAMRSGDNMGDADFRGKGHGGGNQ